jgi:signal transduction histidine kinase
VLAKLDAVLPDPRPISLQGCVIAVALTAIALILRVVLDPWVSGLQFVTFFPAVVLTALLVGVWCGVFAVGLSALCWMLFLAPTGPLQSYSAQQWTVVGIFIFTGMLLSAAVGGLRVAMAETRELKNMLEDRVRERTEELEASASELRALTSNLEALVEDRTRELLKSRDLLTFVLEAFPDGVFLKVGEPDGLRFLYVNSAGERILGKRRDEVIDKPDKEVIQSIHYLEDRKVVATGEPLQIRERKLETLDGPRLFDIRKYPLKLPSDQNVGLLTILRDVTDQRHRDEALRQSQRMDAVGNLTGGVAHDFNNLLAIITGNTELLNERLSPGTDEAALNQEVFQAALRGSELVKRLLAFARKQHLQPQVVKVNERLHQTVALLRRALKEDVQIRVVDSNDLWAAYVDPTQVDDALVNLALNARDSMPKGGTVTIETSNVVLEQDYADQNSDVKPGEYVMLAVSDNGSGMPPEVVQRAFEPFFTTKEPGKGTGLGLSQIYGWIKQSEGHVKIYSEIGHGTTVRLYLPRAGADAATSSERSAEAVPIEGGRERILVVEDNPAVRTTVTRQLSGLGYEPIEAANGVEALGMVRNGTEFDLLFTDMVMPGGLTGGELASEVRKLRPDARILFTSGYTEQAVQGFVAGHASLSKPYRKSDLARAIRAALGK